MKLRILDLGRRFGMPTAQIFKNLGDNLVISVPVDVDEAITMLKTCDLVSFGGGGDIHPHLYNHTVAGASVGHVPSFRDLFESVVFRAAVEENKPILGICRGAQLACAMSGGFLIQHVNGHCSGPHNIMTNDGRKMAVPSVHHQLMYPFRTKHTMLAWSEELLGAGSYRMDYDNAGDIGELTQEPEVVLFSETKSLGVQGHPEFISDPNHPCVKYTREMVGTHLLPSHKELLCQ